MAPQFTIHVKSKASPEQAYDILADVSSHLVWNGEEQAKDFRLLTLESEPGPVTTGGTFSSTGSIPFSNRIWSDRSTVTEAVRPHVFAFETQGTIAYENGDRMEAAILHRYVFEPSQEGCRISYTMKQLSLKNGMWRISWPVLRTLTWRFGIPMATKRGLKALAKMAEAGSPRAATALAEPRKAD